jgi:hypothetical protein
MGQRLELQTLLESVLGSRNVYFQPPENLRIQYPCIVYSRDSADARYADNRLYKNTQRYQVTVIAQDPDSSTPLQVAHLPLCRFDRFFTADNLNHDVFTLFF